jgi:3-phosphoshikimate 1-carboxyvinyltransferase
MLRLRQSSIISNSRIRIPGSKSESNRALILAGIYPEISVGNLSDADDTRVLKEALPMRRGTVDIGHAGTAMRFLTAFFAMRPGTDLTITGSPRMQQRPVGILVDALRTLGADIEYGGIEGFPPLIIKGRQLRGGTLAIRGDVSSQFISSVMLSAPMCTEGVTLNLTGNVTSRPYIGLTAGLMRRVGIPVRMEPAGICVPHPGALPETAHIIVEPDWSSASYYYSIIALSPTGSNIHLDGFRADSLQGDSALAEIYRELGVETSYTETGITLIKTLVKTACCVLDLADTPDLAQTIAVTCLGLNVGCHLTGLHTLRIKETDRLQALQAELGKLGGDVKISENSISVQPSQRPLNKVIIDTYDDHRMAMAFAPLAVITDLRIHNPEVVSKSYPLFWEHLKTAGFQLEHVHC